MNLRDYVEKQQEAALALEQMLEALSAMMEAEVAPGAQQALLSAAWFAASKLNTALDIVNIPEGDE